jgi:CRISPR-associated protein Cmr3
MTKYLIKLKPIEKYFFGDDKGFNTSVFRKNDNDKSYIINSKILPQQTSILGMLRFEILKQSDEFEVKAYSDYGKEDLNKMNNLIGKNSFKIEGNLNEFGKIIKIGNVNLYNDIKKEMLCKNPLDHNMDNKQIEVLKKYQPLKLSEEKIISNFGEFNYFKDFKTKEGLSYDWINSSKEIIETNEILVDNNQVGIDTNKKEIEKEKNGFYKQVYRKMRNEFCFAFIVELNGFEMKNSIVEMGKERSSFKMIVEKIDNDNGKKLKFDDKIYCESDVYLSEEQMKRVTEIINFKIDNAVSFRNLKRINRKYNFDEFKYNFLSRGSVLFIESDKKKEVISIIEENKNLTNVGYNIVY